MRFRNSKAKARGRNGQAIGGFRRRTQLLLCKKPPDRRASETRTLKMSTTDGAAYLVSYHEHCFREWLENAESVVPLSEQMLKDRKSL
jgi:hypothetical protein